MTITADTELKNRHRVMWALGDYPAVASEVIADLGPRLVEACGITADDEVCDVAAGSGNVAIPAARLGARVIATDLTPELLDVGRAAAEAEGLEIKWQVADAEDMPCDSDRWDVVTSCVGVMFAPHHQPAADELVRITRPGGTIGLINWTPEGVIGQLFATMRPYVPAPPPGVQPPPLWGHLDHMRALLGDRVTDIEAHQEKLRVTRFNSGAEFRDFFKATYGPTIAAYKAIADDAEKVASLDLELAALGDLYFVEPGVMEWEYLLFTARRV